MTIFSSGVSLGITGHDYPRMDLYIHGGFNDSSDLYISGPDYESNINLAMNPNYKSNITINTRGKDTKNNSTPLFIGKENLNNNNISLYINNDSFAASSEYSVFNTGTLIISGTDGSSYDVTTIFLKISNMASGDVFIPLFLNVEEPIIGSGGGIFNSGVHSLFVQGNNDANIAYEKGQNTTLYLAAYPEFSEDMSLFLDRPISEVIPLNINAFIASGDMNVYISGNYIYNNNTTLFIKPPESNNFKFFFRGYLE